MTADASCTNTPTARSDIARLRNIFFNVAGIDEAFHRARIERRFPKIAVKENNKFIAQNTITKGSLNWTSFACAFNFWEQNAATMANVDIPMAVNWGSYKSRVFSDRAAKRKPKSKAAHQKTTVSKTTNMNRLLGQNVFLIICFSKLLFKAQYISYSKTSLGMVTTKHLMRCLRSVYLFFSR